MVRLIFQFQNIENFYDKKQVLCLAESVPCVFLERDAPYNPLCTHYNNTSNDNDNDVVGHSTKYTFYRVTY